MTKKIKGKFIFGLVFVVLLSVYFAFFSAKQDLRVEVKESKSKPVHAGHPDANFQSYTLKAGENFFEALVNRGVSSADANQIIVALKKWVDFRYLRSGQHFSLAKDALGNFALLRFPLEEASTVYVKRGPEDLTPKMVWNARLQKDIIHVRLLNYSGEVSSSLWESALEVNMDPALIAELTEIFAWQIDFARELRKGDRWRLTVEQRLVRDRPIGWGRIIAAQYKSEGQNELHTAALFRNEGRNQGYFDLNGESLRKMFLRSPVRFSRISSRFQNRRFHPILKRYKAHNGVDYAAARGAPVRSVGDGVVKFAGTRGGGGKTVSIQHNSVYKTQYKHLSGYAKGVRSGSRVSQGQVIGYVGATGLATGPHLHFEFYENGRYIDPLGKKFPSAEPVSKVELAEFKKRAEMQLETLPDWKSPHIHEELRLVSHELTERLNREALDNETKEL